MKRIVLLIGLLVALASMLVTFTARSQTTPITMKLNAGIVTPHLEKSKEFYTRVLNFGVTFENEFYVLLHTPGHTAEISFLLPHHASQQPLFQSPFAGTGVYLTLEVAQVDKEYARIKALGVPIAIALRDEPWGDRHFAITDPNGVNIDIVTYNRP